MSRVDFPANQSREGGSAGIYHQPSLKTWWTRIDPYCMFDAYCKSPLFQGSFMGIPEYRNPHHPPWCLSSYQQQHWKPDPHRRHGDPGSRPPSISIPGWCIYILLMSVSENWGIPPNDQKLLFYFFDMFQCGTIWWSTNKHGIIYLIFRQTQMWQMSEFMSLTYGDVLVYIIRSINMKMTLRTVFFAEQWTDRNSKELSHLCVWTSGTAANHCLAAT